MILRILALLLALPLLALGLVGLGAHFAPGLGPVMAAQQALGHVLEGALGRNAAGALDALAGLLPGGILSLSGLALLLVAARSRGGADAPEVARPDALPAVDKRLARKVEKQAAALARKGEPLEAAEICAAGGLLESAASYFIQGEEFVRAAEIRHDQNRFAEAADLYIRAGLHETAGTILASHNDFGQAADCYRKAGRMSVAAEMYEKAQRFAEAGGCYAQCDFHRQAARAFVKAQDWPKAAKALERVVQEEGTRAGSGRDPAKEAELRKLVLQAGKLYEQAGDPEAAQRVLERGECFDAAARIAARREDFAAAADFFQRAGDPVHAAEAMRRIGEEQAAAQLLGEYHRDRGELEEAARLLGQAGDYGGAGDLYRQLEDYKLAGECYERQGDGAQAGDMFRLAGDYARAAGNFERLGRFEDAAEGYAQIGDSQREAECLERAGLLLRTAEIHLREGRTDDAIRVLQQVKSDRPEFKSASALLGEIFRSKGQHTLAVKKLSQAIGDGDLDGENLDLHYSLAQVHEAAGEARQAAEIYEKILAADYHYKDVAQRLEAMRPLLASAPPVQEGASASQEAQTPPAGRPGRYRIVGELGRGGMGIVYKAQDTVLDRPVAFKVLPDALRDNPQALKNFLREAKSAAKLNHPNIVTVYDAGEQDGRFYIAMEYVDGTTLKEIVRRRGVISPAGVLHVTVQMCEALAYAHAQKVVHRDIKTANTMWTREKKAKIMDFGLAKVVEEVRNHTTLVSGTPYYMSPEQTLGKNVDHRTDIYSLGVTLFELATGVLPFKEGNVPYHHVHTPPPDPCQVNPSLPAPLGELIFRCLQKDPDARFQDASEIVERVREMAAR